MATQQDKIATFRALHESGCFVIANAWDAGSAKVLAGLGFPALATSSGASAGYWAAATGR
jgi:2-methylisocitrate lyase-like PEP mutase family enzyme